MELLRNVKDEWWRDMVQLRDDVVGIDSAILQARQVWQASGHEEVFTDPLVECSQLQRQAACSTSWRTRTPAQPAGKSGTFTEPQAVSSHVPHAHGPGGVEENLIYLRPETAQGIFINFENIRRTNRLKLPFGIAQVGKSFRNEITPGQFVFRTREFEQMEMEYLRPARGGGRMVRVLAGASASAGISDLGMTESNLRIRPHDEDELSHYSAGTVDIEYRFPWDWDELEGIANRTDFDLKQHSEHSGEDLRYFDPDTTSASSPTSIEPAAGATRTTFAFLIDAYRRGEGQRRDEDGSPPRSPSGPLQGGDPPAVQEGRADRAGGADRRPSCAHAGWSRWTSPSRSVGATGVRTRSAPRMRVTVDFESLDDQSSHRAGPGLHGTGPGLDRPAHRPSGCLNRQVGENAD